LRAADCIRLLFFATDNEQLIAAVYSRQALWQQKRVNHHNRGVNEKLWEEAAVSLGTSSNSNVGRPSVHVTRLLQKFMQPRSTSPVYCVHLDIIKHTLHVSALIGRLQV
jgi:hypothetical protein